MNKPILYRVGVNLLGGIYKWYYKPQIKGVENICDGNIIIAGNHIHLYDQCNILISTKRFVTYMAKKEYFDSKKTRWFFKGVGCIPVDRENKDKVAVNRALEILNNKGAIGIFPEGTRNALKEKDIKKIYNNSFKNYNYEEFIKQIAFNDSKLSQILFLEKLYIDKKIKLDEYYNALLNPNKFLISLYDHKIITSNDYYESLLLDLKYGVVSMASKTNSKIIPVITTGNYDYKSKNLKINIGKPFSIKDLDLEEANKLLRKKMIKLLKENIKL